MLKVKMTYSSVKAYQSAIRQQEGEQVSVNDVTWLVRGERNVLTLREAFLQTSVTSLSQSLVLQ